MSSIEETRDELLRQLKNPHLSGEQIRRIEDKLKILREEEQHP